MFEIIHELTESTSFRNESSLDRLDDVTMKEMLFVYVCVLSALHEDDHYGGMVRKYLRKAVAFSNYDYFRSSSNDLYMLSYDAEKSKYYDGKNLVRYVRTMLMGNKTVMYPYLISLYRELGIKDNELVSLRVSCANWNRASSSEQNRVLRIADRRLRKNLPLSDIKDIIKGSIK